MHRRRLALTAAAVSALTLSLLPAAGLAGGASAADEPEAVSPLALVAAPRAEMYKYGNRAYGDLGLRVVAQGAPFEVRTQRAGWDSSPVTTLVVDGEATRTVPRGMMAGFDRLRDFVAVTIRDKAGKVVVRRDQSTCLNSYEPQRMTPSAPADSPYPYGCPSNPFTIGAVQGVQEGWGSALSESYAGFKLGFGKHRVTAVVAPKWRSLLGISAEDARVTYPLWVRRDEDLDGGFRPTARPQRPNAAAAHPEPEPPTDGGPVPDGPLADLEALPAFGMGVEGDQLQFSATVWNAGDSPLVVDGFRRRGEEMMDAYQYFYDAEGAQTGYRKIGAMHWHAAPSHHHWHFLDFARYRLLSKDKSQVVKSRKQSFCLANTDAVDYTIPGADWQPDGTDLSSACGARSALSIRQVLSAGSGDTYSQMRAGQSFNLKGLPNGQYWVSVEANPLDRLIEPADEDVAADTALRKVWIGGKPGRRTVKVAPVGLVTTP